MSLIFRLEEPFGLCDITSPETLLMASPPVLEIPNTAGTSENPKFIGHVVAHSS